MIHNRAEGSQATAQREFFQMLNEFVKYIERNWGMVGGRMEVLWRGRSCKAWREDSHFGSCIR